uniref:Uncharacterized protein n=1 Tax=Mycena chlorophos TaxID=658473 RepID=A0ABQ0M421_MYCCL|nr:predicted protein [Mycena chlorophos]
MWGGYIRDWGDGQRTFSHPRPLSHELPPASYRAAGLQLCRLELPRRRERERGAGRQRANGDLRRGDYLCPFLPFDTPRSEIARGDLSRSFISLAPFFSFDFGVLILELRKVPWAPYLGTIELPPMSPAHPQPESWAPMQTPVFPIDLLAPIPATPLTRLTDIIPPHARVNVKTMDTNETLFVIHTGSTTLTSADFVQFLSWFQQMRVDPAIKPFVRCGSQLRRAAYGRTSSWDGSSSDDRRCFG